MPDRENLYHYTTIETLELILRNRTIRFNKLTNTDDLEESLTRDIGASGQYVFVSCWTPSDVESIPLWYMYSNKLKGVRIGLPLVPFKDYYRKMIEIPSSERVINEVKDVSKVGLRLYLPLDEMLSQEHTIVIGFNQFTTIDDLRVQYTTNEEILCSNVLKINSQSGSVDFGSIGAYKRECWRFQNEARYRLYAAPISFLKMYNTGNKDLESKKGIERIINQNPVNFDFKDLQIDDNDFAAMEIMLGPGVSDSQREKVDLLVNQYNPTARIVESELLGKVRVTK